jgi:2-succinyl-5-enolpyruvyl-6-hydroxy-3-cyclohexene-1-carboxylate synthase
VRRDEFEALFGTPTGLSPKRAAASWDLPFRRIASPGELQERPEGVEVVEVPADRRRGVELRRELMSAAAEAAARSASSARR